MPHYGNIAPDEMGGDYWTFPARLSDTDKGGIIDGDTLDVTCDLGFQTRRDARIRLYGVNTAEIYGRSSDSEEYKRGIIHRDFVAEWTRKRTDAAAGVEREFPFLLLSKKAIGIYGRYTADLIDRETGESLVDALIQEFDDV